MYLSLLCWCLLSHYSTRAGGCHETEWLTEPHIFTSSPSQKRLTDLVPVSVCCFLCTGVTGCSHARWGLHVCAYRLLLSLTLFTVHPFLIFFLSPPLWVYLPCFAFSFYVSFLLLCLYSVPLTPILHCGLSLVSGLKVSVYFRSFSILFCALGRAWGRGAYRRIRGGMVAIPVTPLWSGLGNSCVTESIGKPQRGGSSS